MSVYGKRGERPYIVYTTPEEAQFLSSKYPGVQRVKGGVACAWDVVNIVRAAVEQPPLPDPLRDKNAAVAALPGLARYKELGLGGKLRKYQKEDAVYMALRDYCINGSQMRLGKTREALAAAVLVNARRVIIIGPAKSKWVWADELWSVLGEECLLLEGRSGTTARRYCGPCRSTGRVGGKRCTACKARNGSSYGSTLFEILDLVAITETRVETDEERALRLALKPEKRKTTKKYQYTPLPAVFKCPKHDDVTAAVPGPCTACRAELHAAIAEARYIFCNFELTVEQQSLTAAGKVYYREDLPGWVPALQHHAFDVMIIDELHECRGLTTNQQNKGRSFKDKVRELAKPVPKVWGLTGTPVFGHTKDLYNQLDITTGGLYGKNFFPFVYAYCEAKRGEYGFEMNGRSERAVTELPERMNAFLFYRNRRDAIGDMPPKTRQVVRLEAPVKFAPRTADDEDGAGSKVAALIQAVAAAKRPFVVDNVIAELAEGNKVFVLAYHRASAEALATDLEKSFKAHSYVTRMRQVDATLWFAHGAQDSKIRTEYARAYREHEGAAVFVSTIDAMKGAISLKGCTSVHFADWHHSPGAMLQAEDRGYEPGTTGMAITYYVLKGSIDEHLEALLLPKFETLDKIAGEVAATEMLALLVHEDPVDEIWAKLTALSAEDDEDA